MGWPNICGSPASLRLSTSTLSLSFNHYLLQRRVTLDPLAHLLPKCSTLSRRLSNYRYQGPVPPSLHNPGSLRETSKSVDGLVIEFTGIQLNTDKMEAPLPRDKLNRAN